jgi:hypothetical protein
MHIIIFTSLGALKSAANWFVLLDFVFYLEVRQQKVERYAFSFSDSIRLNKACNKPENE